MPRRTKLTPELQKRFYELLAVGNYNETACRMLGIDSATFYRWRARGLGANAREPYRGFCEAIEKATAEAEARNVVIIQKAAKTSWFAAAWFLERKFAQRWAKDKADPDQSGNLEELVTAMRAAAKAALPTEPTE
jgi:hypothetical protein